MKAKAKYSDEVLIAGVRDQKSFVFEYLLKSGKPSIEKYVLDNSGTKQDADDVCQEALIVLYRKVKDETFVLTSALSTFYYAICIRIWKKQLSKNLKLQKQEDAETISIEDSETSIDTIIDLNERRKLFRDEFNKLGDNCKKLLKLFLLEISIKDITRMMNYSSDQITKNYRVRCKKHLIESIRNTTKYKELYNGKHSDNREVPRW